MSEKKNGKLILAIDTTGKNANVTVSEGEASLLVLEDKDDSRSSGLLNLIDNALITVNLAAGDIDLFAYASGPGSFTGIRVGISTLKAMNFALRKDCVGVPTLKAIAHMVNGSGDTFTLMPSRRGELFCQHFKEIDGKVQALGEVEVADVDNLLERLKANAYINLAGYGAQLYENEIKNYAKSVGIDCLVGKAEDFRERQNDCWYLLTDTTLSKSVAALALEPELFDSFNVSSRQAIYTT